MKAAFPAFPAFTALMTAALFALTPAATVQAQAQEQAAQEHAVFTPEDIEWGPGLASLPPGTKAIVLYGDPATEGQFVLRLKMPADYYIPPHTHPLLESVTVLSGTFLLGEGETPDRDTAHRLPAGSYFGMPPGMVHYAYTEGETVVQLNGIGPWQIDYINPADDPRL